jgi:hypothetical protein
MTEVISRVLIRLAWKALRSSVVRYLNLLGTYWYQFEYIDILVYWTWKIFSLGSHTDYDLKQRLMLTTLGDESVLS